MPGRIPMTARQRAGLLALPDNEAMVIRHHGLDAEDLAAIGTARTPATRLGYALQLCCLRYPGRHLRRGELLPAVMQTEAMPTVDGCLLLYRLLDEMRVRRIVIPGISVVERMAAEAMHRAEVDLVASIDGSFDVDMCARLDALIDDKVHDRQSRLSWLREPQPRVASASLTEILDKVEAIRWTGATAAPIDPRHEPRLAQFAREGVRYTAQAFQQMRSSRRRVVLFATLREMEKTLTDAAIAMFGALIGRAHLRARKRLEQRIATSGREGRERLIRVARVLGAVRQAARSGADIAEAVRAIASFDTLDADAEIIRRSASARHDDALDEIAAEHRTFKRIGPAFLRAFDFQGRASTSSLRQAMAILADLDGDGRKSLPPDVPLGHVERRWRRHVLVEGRIDRTHWELATLGALQGLFAKPRLVGRIMNIAHAASRRRAPGSLRER